MEKVLTSGRIVQGVLNDYPETEYSQQPTASAIEHATQAFGAPRSIFHVREKMREMGPTTKRLFGRMETLLRLILVCRVTLCEAERSFSALRIVKSLMRSCIGQFFFLVH